MVLSWVTYRRIAPTAHDLHVNDAATGVLKIVDRHSVHVFESISVDLVPVPRHLNAGQVEQPKSKPGHDCLIFQVPRHASAETAS